MDKAGRVPPFPAACLHLRVELVDQRCHREPGVVAVRFLQADREILSHPLHGKAEIKFSLEHRAGAVFHLPGLRSSLRNHVDDLLAVEAGAAREIHGFGQALEQASNADLVDHFRELAGPGRPHQRGGAGVAVDQPAGTLKRAGIATDHDGELAVFCSCLTAGDRGVEKSYAAVGTGGREFPGDSRGRCRVIDQN